jgi:signal peptide peptidase SppA
MNRYRRIVEYMSSHPWAIQRETLDGIVELIRLRVGGGRLADDEIAVRLAAARAQHGERKAESFVGVIPVYGVIMPKANLMTEMSGGTTVDAVRAQFRALMADPEVSRIIFDIDSPGGSVEGVPEMAAEIRAARGTKPMTAVANYMAASAAYYWGSQADEFVASPSALVGSIGVYGMHEDWSASNEMEGVKPTYISAGKYKTEGNPNEPLGDEARAHMQSLVDASYDLFIKDVAAGRGVSQKTVLEGYGEGRVFHPEAALARGMIDSIATFDEALASKPPRMRARRQAAEAFVVSVSGEVIEGHEEETDEPNVFEFEREKRHRLQKPA